MQVPPPIKTLYSSPLPDVSHVAPLSLSLVTPRESMERQRLEDERERKLFTQPRLPLLTKDQDDVSYLRQTFVFIMLLMLWVSPSLFVSDSMPANAITSNH